MPILACLSKPRRARIGLVNNSTPDRGRSSFKTSLTIDISAREIPVAIDTGSNLVVARSSLGNSG
jgi:hypothetical protein